MGISRRSFLETAGLTGIAAGCLTGAQGAATGAAGMPTRVLGKTGVRVSILGMGGGSRYLMYKEEDQAVAALQKAFDLGIRYVDSADDYGRDHLSEQWMGKALKGRRKEVFVATKLTHRNGDEAARSVERSLKALDIDQIDLVHIHSLTTEEDLARIEAKGGVLEQLLKLRDQKVMRFIGITSHSDPEVLKTALERHEFDCTQMALNAALLGMTTGSSGGMVPNEAMKTSFETVALPVANRKKMGVLAMKVFAQDGLTGQTETEKLLYYTLSLPVTAAVVGMPKVEHIEENCRLAKRFQPLSKGEMKGISARMSEKHKARLDRFFSGHVDG